MIYVKPEIPDLLETYAGLSGKPALEPILEIFFIILPPLFLFTYLHKKFL